MGTSNKRVCEACLWKRYDKDIKGLCTAGDGLLSAKKNQPVKDSAS